MTSIFHGVQIEEVATSIIPPRVISAAIPFVVGVAPIHLSGSVRAEVTNVPVLVTSYEDFVEKFGSSELAKYTLCEFANVFFRLYGVGPAVIVNVMDVTTHGTPVADADAVLVDGEYTLDADADIETLVVKDSDNDPTFTLNEDYLAAYNSDGQIVITRIEGGLIPADDSALHLDYTAMGETPCDSDDIIGGVVGGVNTGMECIEDVYALHSLIPGLILAPGFSQDPEVGIVMAGKCEGLSSLFKCMAIVDVDSSVADSYDEVAAWKTANNYVSEYMVVCWPKAKLGDTSYWLSNHVAGRIAATDADNGNVPFVSPSNKMLYVNGVVLASGISPTMTFPIGDALNQQGIVTAMNFNGWRCWGNRTGAFPGNTDVKDAFLPIRRMMNWIGNSMVLLLWQKLDDPINHRTIETAVDSANQWLNGLIGRGAINAGKCVFLPDENSAADLANGKVKLHLYVTPPAPAEQITIVLEYDVSGNEAIFN